ncbi:carboxymuconolactone decarboxylase family protein [Celeribacter halophilus]|uniref:carboxymuconolactone decarboxylase family protein n=1 Tax=Celeribacter halophilus TaxID=576117 RepID=UPI001C07FF44|nr:carboxymuconolactone decarboxylase family protein [Celeribacter halophilus]MBU2890782.1 carboxymuconolactone decarboxylase family protein [Celeribacter halophilus]MDO6510053.1 carboxymuconolactone decarboxylase family protein [Celeribacter halophilus]
MSWSKQLETVQSGMMDFGAALPAVGEGFNALHEATTAEGALSMKHKELQALAIGISKQCVDCIGFHVKAAMEAGATRAEIAETVGVAILMGGGPAYMYGIKAIDAYDEMAG